MLNSPALTIHEALAQLASGTLTAVALPQAPLDWIATVDDTVQDYITLNPEIALEQATQANTRRATGESAPLLGIPARARG